MSSVIRSCLYRHHNVATRIRQFPFYASSPVVMATVAAPQLYQRRWQSSSSAAVAATAAAASGLDVDRASLLSNASGNEAVEFARVWELWNEGNLFSLSVSQMRDFLASQGAPIVDLDGARKVAVVRRVEEFMYAKDSASNAAQQKSQQSPQQQQQEGEYGRWSAPAMQPETLLDLAQSGFYEGAAHMAPKAFQVLADGSTADLVVSRVNTIAFPGSPANLECYTLVSSDAAAALRTRYSKVLQWCFLNMSNLQMDGELRLSLGKLLIDSEGRTHGENIVSAYTIQQRLQLTKPYTFVEAVPEGAVAAAEAFLEKEGFLRVGKGPATLSYEGTIKRAKDKRLFELNENAKLVSLQSEWVDIQTTFNTRARGPDVCALLRSRPPVRRQEVDMFSSFPIVELVNDDVSDVLPPEHGQLTYLSENETRRFERVSESGVVFTVKEVRRQPLIVLLDEEEDVRVEYTLLVSIPAGAASAAGVMMNVRAVGLEAFELANRFADAVTEVYDREFGLV